MRCRFSSLFLGEISLPFPYLSFLIVNMCKAKYVLLNKESIPIGAKLYIFQFGHNPGLHVISWIRYIAKTKIAGWVAGARLAKLKLAVFHRAPRSSAFIRHSSKISYIKDVQ